MEQVMPSPLEAAFDAPDEQEFIEEEVEPLDLEVSGLLQLGSLTDTVTVGKHEIRIRTLRIGEELKAALLANKYKDTIEEARALATALVAASVVTIDGEPLLGQPLGPREHALEAKFDYILENWYWDTINQIWESYSELAKRSRDAAEKLKKD